MSFRNPRFEPGEMVIAASQMPMSADVSKFCRPDRDQSKKLYNLERL
jgi:hypothetical protein